MLTAAIETSLEFLKNLSILSLKDSLLDSLSLRVISLLVKSLLTIEEVVSVFKWSLDKFHNLVTLSEEESITLSISVDCSKIVFDSLIIVLHILSLVFILESPVPSEVAECHSEVRLSLYCLLPACKCLLRLLVVVDISKVVPSIETCREILQCLIENSDSLKTEWEHIVNVAGLSLLEPCQCSILIASSISKVTKPVLYCRIRFSRL